MRANTADVASRASETMSLTQSVLDYEYENGRRYHAYQAGKYPMPNDEQEQQRMDFQHHLYLMIFRGELYRAPLPPRINRALDIGCGTGKWAFDFADLRPQTDVIATDLSVIQPLWVGCLSNSCWPQSSTVDFDRRSHRICNSRSMMPSTTGSIRASLTIFIFEAWEEASPIGRD